MKAYAATDVGKLRSMNQDYIYITTNPVGCLPNLFIVADGMGGEKAGDIASRYTVENLIALMEQSKGKDPVSAITDAIARVNTGVISKASQNEDYQGMGTTLVVATIIKGVLKVANVGDSRLYLVGEDIKQITRDHSLVEELVSLGEINRSEARTHQRKNYITRAIGGDIDVEAEMFSVALKGNERILMCSDGLSNMLEDETIREIVTANVDIKSAVTALVQAANENGGKDNISVIIIEP